MIRHTGSTRRPFWHATGARLPNTTLTSRQVQQQSREVYDHGDGVACLLHDELEDTVLLIRQFRLPAAINGNIAFPIEAPAGVLDGIDPEIRMQRELEEETGYRAQILSPLSTIYMSPGSFTERIHLFTGIYDRHAPVSGGGGNAHEGEDIEVLHIPVDRALQMIADGEIVDAKTVILLQHLALSRAKD
jgi:nudix-type nucleoside diphosphatase (YffH/AdpP family)